MRASLNTLRSNLYQALAEALADPPDWLSLPGSEWPLFEAALQLAPGSEAARQAAVEMLEISGETVEARRVRYAALFAGPGRPRIWIYESGARSGKLFSEVTLEVERWYREAGLEIPGNELPDHASLELAFLAFLSGNEQVDCSRVEQAFLRTHAMTWLPALGQALISVGDLVYAPIGYLLRDWLKELDPDARRMDSPTRNTGRYLKRLPAFHHPEDCNLCSFCVQACPTQALAIFEDQQATSLRFLPAKCIGCARCVNICVGQALSIEKVKEDEELAPSAWKVLRESPRVACQACGKLLVSRAELEYVAACLGNPAWLELCQDCRDEI